MPSLLISLTLLITGCASPGVPRPPSLHIPARVTDLRADRIGDAVVLHWTDPDATTDDVPLHAPLTVTLCRDTLHNPTPPATTPPATTPCTPIRQLQLPLGETSTTDPLPPALLAGPPVALAYHVLLRNAAGHDAGPSNPALAASGPAPAPVTDLRARSVPAGVELTWLAAHSAPGTSIELLRSSSPVSASSQTQSTPRKPRLSLPSSHPDSKQHSAPQPTHLLAVPANNPDHGGTIDPTPERNHTYTYIALRVRTLSLAGASLSLQSADSAPATLLVRDLAPPAAPTELVGVTDGLAADLSWQPSFEPDLAGYLVDRVELPPASSTLPPSPVWQRRTPTPLTAPAFHDTLPHPGRFAFRVLAVDTSGNQGPPSSPVILNVQATTP